jgi:hypothetical protein
MGYLELVASRVTHPSRESGWLAATQGSLAGSAKAPRGGVAPSPPTANMAARDSHPGASATPGSDNVLAASDDNVTPCAVQMLLAYGDAGLLVAVLSRINAAAVLAAASSACKALAAASAHPSVWGSQCNKLWSGKVYVPERCKQLLASGQSALAYRTSLADSRRTRITADELTSQTLRWRFKAAAGEDWTAFDPYWQGEEPLSLRFQPDGRVVRQPRSHGVGSPPVLDDSVELTWRFCNSPDFHVNLLLAHSSPTSAQSHQFSNRAPHMRRSAPRC